ncbi:hypothetical protein [Lichenibacterium ramalinae]|uniref:hypothetical protein n=1 Tax=Lichenibacterium ramalinae TaxID=2316527 RepID=UPI00100F8404|nr:hypothetical protein [Lichenibacterium ramalinae]
MTARCFVDTDVTLDAASVDPAEAAGHRHSPHPLDSSEAGLSAHVPREFPRRRPLDAVRKARDPAPSIEAARGATAWRQAPSFPRMWPSSRRRSASFGSSKTSRWRAAIPAAAECIGAGSLYTEDRNHGQRYGTALVHNPFL